MANYVSYSHLFIPYQAYLSKLSTETEPRTYEEAIKDHMWVEAIKHEITALEDNGTWTVVPLPPGKNAIACKWVFKIKYQANGEIDRFKARLVAKEYNQTDEEIDYQEIFSPVIKMIIVRSVIAIVAVEG